MFDGQQLKVSVSVVCLGPKRVESATELIERRIVDELHLDYFPGGPHCSVGLMESEIRELAGATATIHLWGSMESFERLGLRPRAGLRVVVQQFVPGGFAAAAQLRDAGWDVGWSIEAAQWTSAAKRWVGQAKRPRHIQVLSTTTPGRPGGLFSSEAKAAVECFVGMGLEVSLDGGVSETAVRSISGLTTVVIGTNVLGGRGALPDEVAARVAAFMPPGAHPSFADQTSTWGE